MVRFEAYSDGLIVLAYTRALTTVIVSTTSERTLMFERSELRQIPKLAPENTCLAINGATTLKDANVIILCMAAGQ